MALHDAYLRRTPFELAFRDPARAEALSDAVEQEAEARGVDAGRPEIFMSLASVGSFLSEIRPEEASAAAVHQYAALAFHGVHFVRAGRPAYLLSTGAARALVAGAPGPEARLPSSSGYLQLPQHLFWVEAVEGGVPESVDGVFWTEAADGSLHAMLVTGIRPDRPGVGAVPIPEAPVADADSWKDARVRSGPEGEDFASDIPGAEIDGLYGFRTAGEPLKLLARFFAHVATGTSALVEEDPQPSAEAAGEAGDRGDAGERPPQPGPSPSGLPYRRVVPLA